MDGTPQVTLPVLGDLLVGDVIEDQKVGQGVATEAVPPVITLPFLSIC